MNPQRASLFLVLTLLAYLTLIVSVVQIFPINVLGGEGDSFKESLPNIVLILTDDQGYQDLGCYGSPDLQTPNLDRLASEGIRFTDFYVGQAVCSASRASLLTGCHSHRVGITGALSPHSKIGISSEEMLLSEICKARGYATAIVGKWHLGDRDPFLPTSHGFDEYFGIPYSNDMWPHHPENPTAWPPLPLLAGTAAEGTKPIKVGLDFNDNDQLTTWYTEHAVDFIKRNKERPFFLYVAHNMPHVPLGVSEKFKGKSKRGLYGDVISEIDWSVGEILKTLNENGLSDNTLVIFLSDNGPWLSYGDHAGSAFPLREGKGTSFEGGQRVPCLMSWPKQIPQGLVCNEFASSIDILPSIAKVLGVPLDQARPIDGKSILPLMTGEKEAKSPHQYFPYFYAGNQLQGIRSGDWKMYFPHTYRTLAGRNGGIGGIPVKYENTSLKEVELYHLTNDISETNNVAAQFPDKVRELSAYAEKVRQELGDSLQKRSGSGVREPGRFPLVVNESDTGIAVQVSDSKKTDSKAIVLQKEDTPPNILFLYADDFAHNAMGLSGNSIVKTPTIDRLGASGVLFTNAYNQGGWHGAVCVASREMLNSGRFMWKANDLFRDKDRLEECIRDGGFWSQRLKKLGYETYITGKWHADVKIDLLRLFDHTDEIRMGGGVKADPEQYNRPIEGIPDRWSPADPQFGGYWDKERDPHRHWSEVQADTVIAQIKDGVSRKKPFFIYAAFNAPHDPRQSPKEFLEMYSLDQMDVPASFLPEHPLKDLIGCPATLRDEQLVPYPRTSFAVKTHRREYYAIISHLDTQLKRVLDALEQSGQKDNTLIIFSADNGLSIGAHGLIGKQSVYEHSLRVPLILSGPSIPVGKKIDSPVYLQDIVPTTLEMALASAGNAGVAPASSVLEQAAASASTKIFEGIDFSSLVPLLREKSDSIHSTIYGSYIHHQKSIRLGDWKLVLFPEAKTKYLYHLKDDPDEIRNLADLPESGPRMKRLFVALQQEQKNVGDPFDLAVIYPELVGKRPNIILVMLDDVGYGDFACLGNPVALTPQIDRLAGESCRLTNFHVSPTCSPTRAAFLTGRHEFRSGVTHTILERERLAPSAITIAQLLQQSGYSTGIFGKWHLGDEDAYQPDKRGFDEIFIHGGGGIGQTYPGSCGDVPNNFYTNPTINHNGKFVRTKGFCTDVFFSQSFQWMEKQVEQKKPFFAYLPLNAAHDPLWESPRDSYNLYAANDSMTEMQKLFYGMVSNIDDNMGRLMTWLQEHHLDESTVLIFMTDNGSACQNGYNAGMRGRKGTPYEGGIRVPCFWRWKGTVSSGESDRLTAHLDLFPTLAALAGIEVGQGAHLEGRSLIPLLQNNQVDWKDRLLITHLGRWPTGEINNWKYKNCSIRNTRFSLVNGTELYDLQNDPGQKQNVFNAHPEVIELFRTAYDQWWEEILPCQVNENAPRPAQNPYKTRYWEQFYFKGGS